MIRVTYIEHSGFMIELSDKALLFDYWKGKLPQTDKPLYIFSSHSHRDHFTKKIFDIPCEKFILSDDIAAENADNIIKVRSNEKIVTDGLHIKTLPSTDEGVAFIVEYNKKTIYHAGDLNDWYWEEEDPAWNEKMSGDYRRIITEGFKNVKRPDYAFVPLDPRQGSYCGAGMSFFLDKVGAEHVFPMHFWGNYKCIADYRKTRSENIYLITKAPQVFETEE